MSATAAVAIALFAALLLANLPFLSSRPLVGRRSAPRPKGSALRLLELLLLYAAWMALCTVLESRLGGIHPKDWSVWPISIAFFAVLGFPGLTYRYLWSARTAA